MSDIYLAGSYNDREVLQDWARRLLVERLTVTSSWLFGLHGYPGVEAWTCARQDLAEIRACKILIADCTHSASTRGGRWVEVGYAMGIGKPVIIVSEERPENIFAYADNVHRAYTLDDAIKVVWRILPPSVSNPNRPRTALLAK